MGKRSNGRGDDMRRLLAQEAARIITGQGVRDYGLAKRKAAQRLGLTDQALLPRNAEIEEAVAQQQRLFDGAHTERLLSLRHTARRAMRLFEDFEPRLVGSVLSGTATVNSDVSLHLFADTPELVAIRLMQAEIPYQMADRRVRYGVEKTATYPVYRFVAGQTTIDATVFPPAGLRRAPSCPVDGRPMRRARLDEVEELIG